MSNRRNALCGYAYTFTVPTPSEIYLRLLEVDLTDPEAILASVNAFSILGRLKRHKRYPPSTSSGSTRRGSSRLDLRGASVDLACRQLHRRSPGDRAPLYAHLLPTSDAEAAEQVAALVA
jgi:hypothetical protein